MQEFWQEILWLVVLAVCLLLEAVTVGLVTVWFGVGALVAFAVALFTENLVVQMAVFLLVSFVLLVFTRPAASRYINARRTKTNVEGIIGQQGRVTEQIDNFREAGTVVLNGLEWTARAAKEHEIIEKDCAVVVKRVSGVKVFVEKCGSADGAEKE